MTLISREPAGGGVGHGRGPPAQLRLGRRGRPAPAERLLERADALAAGRAPGRGRAALPRAAGRGARTCRGPAASGPPADRLDEATRPSMVLIGDGLRHAPDQTEFLVLRGGIYAHLRRVRGGGRRPAARAAAASVARAGPPRARPPALAPRAGGGGGRDISSGRWSSSRTAPATCYYLGDALNQAGDLPGARSGAASGPSSSTRATPRPTISWAESSTGSACPDEAREMYQRSRELAGA